jgi:hypothetical protein
VGTISHDGGVVGERVREASSEGQNGEFGGLATDCETVPNVGVLWGGKPLVNNSRLDLPGRGGSRIKTQDPSVAGSSPARRTSLSQWHSHQQVEQQEHAHDQGADESAFDRASQSVRQMRPPIQEPLPPSVFAESQ